MQQSQNDLQTFRNLQRAFYPDNPDVDGNGFNNREIQNELFLGTSDDDFLQGDRGEITDDLIYARAGDDIVNGRQGDDKIFGGIGDDILAGGEGNDLLVGDADLQGISREPSS